MHASRSVFAKSSAISTIDLTLAGITRTDRSSCGLRVLFRFHALSRETIVESSTL